ncbi:MAG: cation:proton antiporter [Bacteroidales bacterium]|nr:cation:proton antiporter [Bacteroidales bacterium]
MTFILLGLLIFCAHLFNAWFSRRRIPDVLLLMIIGILIGPVSGWVTPDKLAEVGPVLASLTLLFILFDSGIDMHINLVQRYWTGVVQVTFFSFVASAAVVGVLAYFYIGLELRAALMLGTMVAGTAAAIVIPVVRQMRVSEKTRVTLTLESAISGVLCIVFSLAFIEGYKLGDLNVGTMLGRVLASILMALIIGLVGGIVWSSLMHRVRTLQNSMFLTPAFVFVLYGITESLGYSGAIAALAFGLVLGNPDYFEMSFLSKFGLHQMSPLEEGEKSFFKEFVFILKTYFFVYIGICIPFTDFHALLYGAVISAALFVIRFAIVGIVGRKNTKADRLTVSMMIPKGLVSAVLASMPEQLNAEMGYPVIECATEIKNITYAVIFCSIIICSLLVLIASKRLVKTDDELDWSGHIAEPDKTKGEQHEIL